MIFLIMYSHIRHALRSGASLRPACQNQKNPQNVGIFKILILAETKGFEPLIRGCRIHDFESRAFNRSATSPCRSL